MITKVKTRKKKKVSLSSVNDDDASQQDKTYSINKMKKNESFLSDEQLSSNKIFNIRHVKMKSMNVSKTKNIRKNLKVEESNTSHRKYLINERLEKGNKGNLYDYNKIDDDVKSISNLEQTFTTISNLISSDTHKMKKVKKTIPEQSWFKNIIYVIIILNTIQLILHTYPKKFWIICNIFEYIFTICFIIEMSIKISFFGFIKNAKSYLRQTPLNILDFLTTIGCTANIIINIISNIKKSEKFPKIFEIKTNYSNFSEFRLFTLLLFPLDHRKIFRNVNFYLLNIKNIFVNLSNVSIFIVFLYLFFSSIGVSFWRGRFSFFCHTQNNPINKNSFPLVDLFQNNFCGGSNTCNSRMDLCLSSKKFYGKGLLEKSVYKKEIDHSIFNYGITKFNNIFQSLLTIFISSTGDGWDSIMSMVMDAHNYWTGFVYFLIMESIFVLFIKNLILIIILLTFENERKLIKQNKVKNKITGEYSNQLLKNANSMQYTKKYCYIKKPDQTYVAKIDKAIKYTNHDYKRNFCICHKNKTNYEKKFFIGYLANTIYQQYTTRIIFNIAIFLNVIIVLAEYIPGNDYIATKLSKKKLKILVLIKLIIVIIYCVDQFLVVLKIGLLKLITSSFYCLDFIFSILCISIFLYKFNNNSSETRNPTIIYGILRVLKFYNPENYKNHHLMMTISSINMVISNAIYIIPIFLTFLLSFSLFGYSLFHDSITFNEFGDYDKNSTNNEINFNDFTNSLFSTFLILLQDDWSNLFYYCYRSEENYKSLVLIFYILIVVFGQVILMSMVLSFLIEQYHYNKEKFENNFDTKNNMICMQLELTKYFQIDQLIHKKKQDYETIIKNLLKMNKRLVGENKEMMLVGYSKINFIKNTTKSTENFYIFRSNKLNTYRKEILIGDVFDNYYNKSFADMENINNSKFWQFNVNYNQKYTGKKKIETRRRKSSEQININCIFNKKNSIKSNNKAKGKDLSSENQIFLNSPIGKMNNKKGIRNSKKRFSTNLQLPEQSLFRNQFANDSIILGKPITEKIDNKSLDYNINHLKRRITKRLISLRKLRIVNERKLPNDFLDEEDEEVYNSNFKKIWTKLKNRSLFLFHWKNKFRIYITNLTSLREFNYIITFLILVHTVVLWFDSPWVEENSSQKYIIDKFNFYLNIAFIIEGILKIIRFGFILNEDSKLDVTSNMKNLDYLIKYLNEENIQNFEEKTENEQIKIMLNFMQSQVSQAYLTNPYNIIDFICIIVSLIDMLNIIHKGILLTLLRAIRSIKPIRFINSSVELRFIMKVFVSSLGDVFSVLLMLIIYMIIISVFAQTLFRDKANYKCTLGFTYLNELDCVQNGGYWVHNPYNFSNFIYSFKNSFEIIMGENLGNIMEETYLLTKNSLTYPFFILAVIIGNIFVLKLLLAVIIQAFRKIQKRDDPYINLTNPEKIWLKLQNEMSNYKPDMNIQFEIKKNSFMEKFVNIISNKAFQEIYLILVIVDIILYMSVYEDAPYTYLNIINYLNIAITIFFNIKAILNFMAYSYSSFNKKWHFFELIITLIGDVALILEIIINRLDDHNRDILNFSQILIEIFNSARIVRLLSLNDYFKELTSLFISIVPRLVSIIALLLIILIVYANLGTIIFGLLPYRTYINNNNNFGNFFNSLMILFQLLTGSEWNMIMNEMAFHDCRNKSSIEYQSDYYCVYYNVTCFLKDSINHTFLYRLNEHRDKYDPNYVLNSDVRNNINAYHLYCGSNGSYIYIISFIVICSILIMSLLVVFILDSYEKSYQIRENIKKGKFMNHVLKIWQKYDLKCRSMINPPDYILFLKEIPPPFGLNYDRLITSNPLKKFKKRKEFLIFKKNLKFIQQKNDDCIIQFDESEINNKYSGLPYCYQFNNFYVEQDEKFFTEDIEMLKILNYLDLIAFIDKGGVSPNKTSAYIFKNKKLIDIIFKNNYIHFIDMCMAMSKLITSRIEGVNINLLRENYVNSYSYNKWMSNFNTNEVMELFNLKEVPNTYRVINKLSNQILARAQEYYKIIQKNYLKKNYLNKKNDNLQKLVILPIAQLRKNDKQKSDKPKVIKIFTRTTTRGSYVLLPNSMINRNNNIKGRKKSDADAFKIIKKEFGKK